MRKIKIMIADDHAMIRQGIKQILELEDDFYVVAQAADGEAAISLAQAHTPDVILMDINMPKLNGIQATEKLLFINPKYKIIMLTLHQDIEYMNKTVQIGAKGYVIKDAEAHVLVEAIRAVYRGESYIQPELVQVTVINEDKKLKTDENGLSIREREVLALIAKGMVNKDIAKNLFISEKTVKNHVSNIFKKIDVSDRTQAAIFALKNGVVSKEEKN